MGTGRPTSFKKGREVGFLVSMDERKSHVGKLYLLPTKGSVETMMGIVTVLRGYKVSSITYDSKPRILAAWIDQRLVGLRKFFL